MRQKSKLPQHLKCIKIPFPGVPRCAHKHVDRLEPREGSELQ